MIERSCYINIKDNHRYKPQHIEMREDFCCCYNVFRVLLAFNALGR